MTDCTNTGTTALDPITSTGIYAITRDGAQRGDVDDGLGAKVNEDIYLQTGNVLDIVVNGEGNDNKPSYDRGGGGAYLETSANHGVITDGATNGHGGHVDITLDQISMACYRRGTRILTPGGEVCIEDLDVGDVVMTLDHGAQPVTWLGHRLVDCASHPAPQTVWPVRVQCGAFAEAVPSRDLYLSPDYAIFCDGVLIEAKNLVNGANIAQIPCESVEYWHLELAAHDIVFAENLPAESARDTGHRTAFTGGETPDPHPDFARKHPPDACVPLVFDGDEMQRTRAELLARAEVLGHRITTDDDLHVLADGKRIDPLRLNGTRTAFVLPANAANIQLRSRSFVPAHTKPASADTRTLGLCLKRLQLDGADMPLDEDRYFTTGWSHFERPDSGPAQRWTTGSTPLPPGTRHIILDYAGLGHYWVPGEDTAKTSASAVQSAPSWAVDVVIPWVDSRDPAVSKLLKEVSDQLQTPIIPSRFTSNGEIFWCVKFIRKFIPWVNKIYIVTNGQSLEIDDVTIVYHHDIFPDSVKTPCFNSEVIEWYCHRIDGLSERFIIFNDDTFIGRALTMHDFSGNHGLGLTWFDHSPILPGADANFDDLTQSKNQLNTFLKFEFSSGDFYVPAHVPRFYFKPTVQNLFTRYQPWIELAAKYQIRSVYSFPLNTINTYHNLKQVYGTCDIAKLIESHHEDIRIPPWNDYVFIPYGDEDTETWFKTVREMRPKFFCINDHIKGDRKAASLRLDAFLRDYFVKDI